ncbi:MAG: hypothetical protein ACR2NP_11410 [Pirellulaceae bacterium]
MKCIPIIACSLIAVIAAVIPATAQVRITHSYSHQANSLQSTNTPLSEAISMVGQVTGTDILIDVAAIEGEGISLDAPVTVSITDATGLEILEAILPNSLAVKLQGGKYVVSTRARIETGEPLELSALEQGGDGPSTRRFVDADILGLERTMQQRIPVHFQDTPLEFAVQMLAGFSGKHVRFDPSAQSKRMIAVTLHRDGAMIQDNLDEILDAASLTWEVAGQALIIKANG